MDIRTLAEHLGHHDPAFTLRVYCHLIPSSEERVRTAVDRALGAAADCPRIAREGETGGKQAYDLRPRHFNVYWKTA